MVNGVRLQHIDRYGQQCLNKVRPQEFHPLAHFWGWGGDIESLAVCAGDRIFSYGACTDLFEDRTAILGTCMKA